MSGVKDCSTCRWCEVSIKYGVVHPSCRSCYESKKIHKWVAVYNNWTPREPEAEKSDYPRYTNIGNGTKQLLIPEYDYNKLKSERDALAKQLEFLNTADEVWFTKLGSVYKRVKP